MSIQSHRLSVRYLRNFLLLVVIPVCIFAIFVNGYYDHFFLSESESRMYETVSEMVNSLDNEIKNVSILSSALVHNRDFLRTCEEYNFSTDHSEQLRLIEKLDSYFSSLFLYTNKIGSIYTFFTEKPVYLYRNFPITYRLPHSPKLDKELKAHIESRPNRIYIQDDLFSLHMEPDSPHAEAVLNLLVHPSAMISQEVISAMLFSFGIKFFQDLHNAASTSFFSFITDASGNLILESREHSLGSRILESMKDENIEDSLAVDHWLLARKEVPSTGWYVYYAADLEKLREPFVRIQRIFILVLVGLIALFIFYTVLFFHNLVTPVNGLMDKMLLVEKGNYQVQVPPSGPVEMQHLIDSFNRMIGQVDQLTREKEKQEKERSHLEMEALQSQIHPHFIANTLNSIRLMAVVNKDEHIKEMTTSLMRLINDSFREEGSCTTLGREMESLQAYVHIMKVRFGNRIELKVKIPAALIDKRILKMLLQPLVENSIVHGFAEKKDKGIIEISAEVRKGSMFIRLADNGCGFDGESNVLPEPKERKAGSFNAGIGLRNVDRRIKLNYGHPYGLEVSGSAGKGTTAVISLPLEPEEGCR